MDDAAVRALFERYERHFNRALADADVDMAETASLYAAEFIGSTPAGVMAGRNDDEFKQVMAQGYAHYRAIGTRKMAIRKVRITPIDEQHCLAQIDWTATYARAGSADKDIDFEGHYLVRQSGNEPKVFGWMAGDEEARLRERGIV